MAHPLYQAKFELSQMSIGQLGRKKSKVRARDRQLYLKESEDWVSRDWILSERSDKDEGTIKVAFSTSEYQDILFCEATIPPTHDLL